LKNQRIIPRIVGVKDAIYVIVCSKRKVMLQKILKFFGVRRKRYPLRERGDI